MDDSERLRYYTRRMSEDCLPLAQKAADLLEAGDPRVEEIMFDLAMRSFFAGWHLGVAEAMAQAVEQGLEIGGIEMGVELPDGPLSD